jgi:hypothetical protein
MKKPTHINIFKNSKQRFNGQAVRQEAQVRD